MPIRNATLGMLRVEISIMLRVKIKIRVVIVVLGLGYQRRALRGQTYFQSELTN